MNFHSGGNDQDFKENYIRYRQEVIREVHNKYAERLENTGTLKRLILYLKIGKEINKATYRRFWSGRLF